MFYFIKFVLVLLIIWSNPNVMDLNIDKRLNTPDFENMGDTALFKLLQGPAAAYSWEKIEYVTDKINIVYPQIAGELLNDNYAKINSLIKDSALFLSPKSEDDAKRVISLVVNYKINFSNSKLVSITFWAISENIGPAHPYLAMWTINIGLDNAQLYKATDFLIPEHSFIQQALQYKFLKGDSLEFKYRQLKRITSVLPETYMEYFQGDYGGVDNITPYPQSMIYTFYTSDCLGIIISIDYTDGSFALLEIPYEYIDSYLMSTEQ